MSRTLVYQFGLLPPTSNGDLVNSQLRAAHEYRNLLVEIERGRRHALRLLEFSPQTDEAVGAVKAATRATRKEALKALARVRKETREAVPAKYRYDDEYSEAAGCCPLYELERIGHLDAAIRRSARAATSCYWGTYLGIEAAADQVRKMPLYDEDGLTPSDPRFQRWTGAGQLGVQLQGGLAQPEAASGEDTRVSLRDGVLSIRVGSDGRAPIWARLPVARPRRGKSRLQNGHRCIPDNATWKWCRVSKRKIGPWWRWTCEITVELPGEHPRFLDKTLEGAIAVEVAWDKPGDEIVIARWRDTSGESGAIELPTRIRTGIVKPAGIRAVRDLLRNELRGSLARVFQNHKPELARSPRWLVEAAGTLHLWQAQERFYKLLRRWQDEKHDGLREAYEILDAWRIRDSHLYEYETGARRNVLGWRKDLYRKLAAGWSRRYLTAVLDDRDLSREARWGDESDVRFAASPSELRTAVRQAFAGQVAVVSYRPKNPDDGRDWCERAIDAWNAGAARVERKVSKSEDIEGGAWKRRKERKNQRAHEEDGARKAAPKVAE